jgi:molybdate transport system regulatory protein
VSTNTKVPRLWLRIVVPEIGAIGPGKITLLRAIDKTRSISAAARQLGMSYRRAWMLLDETKKIISEDVIKTHAGGADRGGAELTGAGRRLIQSYDRICAAADRATAIELKKLLAPIRPTALRSRKRSSARA